MFKEIRSVGFIAGEVIRAGLHILISGNSNSIQEIKVDYSLPKRLRASNVPEFALFLYVGVFVLPTKILLKRLNYKHKIHVFIYTDIYSINSRVYIHGYIQHKGCLLNCDTSHPSVWVTE